MEQLTDASASEIKRNLSRPEQFKTQLGFPGEEHASPSPFISGLLSFMVSAHK